MMGRLVPWHRKVDKTRLRARMAEMHQLRGFGRIGGSQEGRSAGLQPVRGPDDARNPTSREERSAELGRESSEPERE